MAIKKATGDPFGKQTGINLRWDTWNGSLSPIRAGVETKKVAGDLYPFNPWDVVAGCEEGLFEKLDPKEFELDPSDFYEGAIEPCGISSDIWSYLWAWNLDRNPNWREGNAPTSLQDAFDLKKFPGKRGFRKRVYTTLEYALLGDGVLNKDVYKVLATPEGFKRAIARLQIIKQHTVWLETATQMPQLLADGETALTAIVSSRWYNAKVNEGKNFGAMWNDQVYSYDMWSIPKGAPHLAEAKQFLKYMLRPEQLAAVAHVTAIPPARKSALALVKPEIRQYLPNANFKNELYLNGKFWADHLESYTKQFEAWLAN